MACRAKLRFGDFYRGSIKYIYIFWRRFLGEELLGGKDYSIHDPSIN